MGLVTLAEIKTYLGEATNTYDTFLTEQIEVVSEAVEGYCGRKFEEDEYIQKIYRDDYDIPPKELYLYHFPLTDDVEIEDQDGNEITDFRQHSPSALITRDTDVWFHGKGDWIQITYPAGFDPIPAIIRQVCYSLLEERYNKKKSGLSLSFGSDVQRVSIPGVLSIDYDYSLSTNERKNKFGAILGTQMNMLDPYRSERGLGQSGKIAYVES